MTLREFTKGLSRQPADVLDAELVAAAGPAGEFRPVLSFAVLIASAEHTVERVRIELNTDAGGAG